MTENMGKWPSNRGPISKIMPSDGCKGDTVPLAVERWYDFPNLGVIWEMSVRVTCANRPDVRTGRRPYWDARKGGREED